MSPRTTVPYALCFAAALGLGPASVAAQPSGCGAFGSVSLAFGANDFANRRSGVGGGGGIGGSCGGLVQFTGDFEIHRLEHVQVAYLLAGPSVRLVGGGHGKSWLSLRGNVGVAWAHTHISVTLVLPDSGEGVDFSKQELAFGGGLEYGYPMGDDWSFVARLQVRGTSVNNRSFPDLEPAGRQITTTIPLSAGFRFQIPP